MPNPRKKVLIFLGLKMEVFFKDTHIHISSIKRLLEEFGVLETLQKEKQHTKN